MKTKRKTLIIIRKNDNRKEAPLSSVTDCPLYRRQSADWFVCLHIFNRDYFSLFVLWFFHALLALKLVIAIVAAATITEDDGVIVVVLYVKQTIIIMHTVHNAK